MVVVDRVPPTVVIPEEFGVRWREVRGDHNLKVQKSTKEEEHMCISMWSGKGENTSILLLDLKAERKEH